MRYLILLLISLMTQLTLGDVMTKTHFLIPAGPGGGWDGTARGIGEALVKSGLVKKVSYENLSGGGGGRAIAKLIETAKRQHNTLLISSSPMVIRSLQGIFPQSFRDLVPIASVIADYTCFVVRKDSDLQNFEDVSAAFIDNPRALKVAGGSVRGSTDHLMLAKALQLAGGNPRRLKYIAYDGGGKAMAGLLTGETQLLSTGLSEAIEMARSGQVRIIAVTAAGHETYPTLRAQGIDLVFANWRGFFAAKGLPESQYSDMRETLAEVIKSPEFAQIRTRNGWTQLHYEGQAFYDFLVKQEQEIKPLMTELGFLRVQKAAGS